MLGPYKGHVWTMFSLNFQLTVPLKIFETDLIWPRGMAIEW